LMNKFILANFGHEFAGKISQNFRD